jgi:hypothetical protein
MSTPQLVADRTMRARTTGAVHDNHAREGSLERHGVLGDPATAGDVDRDGL